MNAHIFHTRFRSLLTVLTLALYITGCRPAGEESEECQTDNDIPLLWRDVWRMFA